MAFKPVPFLGWTRFYHRVSRPPVAAPDANSPCAGHEIVAAAAIARQRGPVRATDAAETMTLNPAPIGREIAVKCFLVLLTFRRSPKLRGSPTRDRGSVEAGDARRAWAGREICALDATILIRNLGKSLPNKTQCRSKRQRAAPRRPGRKEGVAFGDAEPGGGPGRGWRRPANQCAVIPLLFPLFIPLLPIDDPDRRCRKTRPDQFRVDRNTVRTILRLAVDRS